MLSKRTYYALKALIALAQDESKEPVMIGDIAERGRIPKRFLEQILLDLKSLGVVQSRKGKLGGYYLSRETHQIRIGMIIRMIDGPLAMLPCVSRTAYEPCAECVDETTCGLRSLMSDVRDATASILDHATLAEILERENRAKKLQPEVMYHI